jgi:hypothetical protein
MFKKGTSIATSLFFVLLVFKCVNNGVYAQESYWYAGASLGEASTSADDIFDDSSPVSFYIGKRLSESFAFEFAYLDLGEFESDSLRDTSVEISGFEASVLALAKVGESVEIFLRTGLYLWEFEAVVFGTDVGDEDGTTLLLGFGVNVPVSTIFGFRAEYMNYFDIEDEDVDAINLGLYANF